MFLLSPLFADREPSTMQLECLASVVSDPSGMCISTLDIPEFMSRALCGSQEHYDLYAELLNRCEPLDFTVSDSSFFMAVRLGLDAAPDDVMWMSAAQAANRGLTYLCADPTRFRRFPSLRCLSAQEFMLLRPSSHCANDDRLYWVAE